MTSTSVLRNSTAPFPRVMPSKLYTGPAMPVAYDPQWRGYTNLTPVQISAFQAMPETCQQVARDLRDIQVRGILSNAKPNVTKDMTLTQVQDALEVSRVALDTAKTAVAAPFATEQSVLANIGKTVKTQDDVVRVFNSPKT